LKGVYLWRKLGKRQAMARDRWEWNKTVLEAKIHKEVLCPRSDTSDVRAF
jgi:hypothetical protein